MKHKKAKFVGGSSWHDPDKVVLNLTISMIYLVGLWSFQRMTGLMDLGKPTSSTGMGAAPLVPGDVAKGLHPTYHRVVGPLEARGLLYDRNGIDLDISVQGDDPRWPEGLLPDLGSLDGRLARRHLLSAQADDTKVTQKAGAKGTSSPKAARTTRSTTTKTTTKSTTVTVTSEDPSLASSDAEDDAAEDEEEDASSPEDHLDLPWEDEGHDGNWSLASNESSAANSSVEVVAADPLFPEDIFTPEQLRQGWVVLYIIGMIYMFVALAIVCDEFFVPALDVIIEVLGCSEDVAGATFMAAGGSAPELFTSVIGVFVAFSDVGIGTIVGSAVFNILFVIGMCALFSKTVLHLTWWPLFRDCAFYSLSLISLILFFLDEYIEWWEALFLLLIYAAYVIFMKFNVQAERFIKRCLYKNKVTRVRSTDHLVPSAGATGAAMSGLVAGEGGQRTTGIPVLHAGSHFRHGLLQLMIHTIDPLHDGKVDEKATQLHAIASLKVILDANKPQDGVNGNASSADGLGGDQGHDSGRASQGTEVNRQVDAYTNADQLSQLGQQNGTSWNTQALQVNEEGRAAAGGVGVGSGSGAPGSGAGGGGGGGAAEAQMLYAGGDGVPEEVQPQPLDMRFPNGIKKQITYLLLFPIIFPLWMTLPDTRSPKARKFYPITFIGSILWIAAFSYLMVWWSTVAGNVFEIPPEVMGLTFLAAGTSIPDLITSVIVARKGFGDMAVSSSVGSNIFDVTVGLPLPWLLYTMVFMKPVKVSATGMVCSVAILFCMLLLVFFSILIFNWKMTKGMGFSMFVFYFVFVAVSLGFEYDFYECPI